MDPNAAQVSSIADTVGVALRCCDDPRLAVALLKTLAGGEPVAEPQLAVTAGRERAQVATVLARWPSVQRDEQGRVIGFSGLSLRPTPHRFQVDGHALFTWCAWDALFLPAVLDRPARVESKCPVTGADVRLTVEPHRIRDCDPQAALVSFPSAEAVSTADITGSFCTHVHFLAGQDAAGRWLRDHPGANALAIEHAFDLGRHVTRPLLAAD